MGSKTNRVEARLSADERHRIDQAAHLVGVTRSSFVVSAAVEKADQVIAETSLTVVPADYFDRLVAAIDDADPLPNLARVARQARKRRRIH